jgi:hypothetical protein
MNYQHLLLGCFCLGIMACNNNTSKQTPSTSIPAAEDTMAQMPGGGAKPSVSTDEQLFQTAFGSFKTAVEQNSEEQLESLINFPLQTTKPVVKPGEISRADLHAQYNGLFNENVRRLLPKAGEDNITVIDQAKEEDYYKTLRQVTDKDSKLFEVYTQYPEKGTNAESYFAFVFGKVKGEYKAVGYYSKWPVKD